MNTTGWQWMHLIVTVVIEVLCISQTSVTFNASTSREADSQQKTMKKVGVSVQMLGMRTPGAWANFPVAPMFIHHSSKFSKLKCNAKEICIGGYVVGGFRTGYFDREIFTSGFCPDTADDYKHTLVVCFAAATNLYWLLPQLIFL
jgi:hypothetical protein